MADRQQVVDALRDSGAMDMEAVRSVSVAGAAVRITLAGEPEAGAREAQRHAAAAAVRALDGVETVEVFFEAAEPAEPARPSGPDKVGPIPLPHVRDVLAVGAGKGGVGKSTVAVHLAAGLGRAGLRVGLLDGDIYGPTIATMAGIAGRQPEPGRAGKVAPFEALGLRVISVANFVDAGAPMLWRGPMVHGVVRQLLGDVDWGPLDVLVVDLPPGTGDVPLTLAQSVPVSGAVVVSTPQPVALDDALRAAAMYEKLGVAVLGLVENMSVFVCDACGTEHDLFGRGGVTRAADARGLACLGALPLDPAVRANTDRARIAANFAGAGASATALSAMVSAVRAALEQRRRTGPPPRVLDVRGGG